MATNPKSQLTDDTGGVPQGENNNYRKWPMEFMYTTEAPKGHLPLTNALRGTQLIQVSLHAVRIPDGPGFAAARGCASDMLAAAAQPPGALRL